MANTPLQKDNNGIAYDGPFDQASQAFTSLEGGGPVTSGANASSQGLATTIKGVGTGTTAALGQATSANSLPVVVASDQSAMATKGTSTEQASLSAAALNAYLVAATDVSAYRSLSLQITGTWSGTIVFEVSNDNTNWTSTFLENRGATSYVQNTNNNGVFSAPVSFRYFRARMSSYSSGTATGTLELYSFPVATNTAYVTNFSYNSAGNVAQSSGTISANGSSSDQYGYGNRGIYVFITTGAFGTGASTITVSIQGKDVATGNYFTILTSVSLAANNFYVLLVYPGITAAANTVANQPIPTVWRVSYQAGAWGTGGSTLGISFGYQI